MSRLTLFSHLARLPGVLRLVELNLGRGDLDGDDPARTWGGSGSAHVHLGEVHGLHQRLWILGQGVQEVTVVLLLALRVAGGPLT